MGKVIAFDGDKSRKHHHFLVTVTYVGSERFGRIYTDLKKAYTFAAREQKSAAVKAVSVQKLD